MSQYHIQFLDGETIDFDVETAPMLENEIASFSGIAESYGEKSKMSIHLSNLAFFRSFKGNPPTEYTENLMIHFKNGTTVGMQKGEITTSGPYLVIDTIYDATFIPMKNIKYHEEF